MKKYDAILCVDDAQNIYENDRRMATKSTDTSPRYFQGSYDYDDPQMYNTYSFGRTLRS